MIFPKATGHIPGLRGRLNPIRNTSDRTYLYADNVAIEEGRPQPVSFPAGQADAAHGRVRRRDVGNPNRHLRAGGPGGVQAVR